MRSKAFWFRLLVVFSKALPSYYNSNLIMKQLESREGFVKVHDFCKRVAQCACLIVWSLQSALILSASTFSKRTLIGRFDVGASFDLKASHLTDTSRRIFSQKNRRIDSALWLTNSHAIRLITEVCNTATNNPNHTLEHGRSF